MNRRHADFQSNRLNLNNNRLAIKEYQDKAGTFPKHDTAQICEIDPEKNENPGALAGATGAEYKDWLSWIDNNLKREAQARDLARAVAKCEPEDRVPHLIGILEQLLPSFRAAFQVRLMQEARWLVACLAYRQRKALALAAYESLAEDDQRSFVAHITGARNV